MLMRYYITIFDVLSLFIILKYVMKRLWLILFSLLLIINGCDSKTDSKSTTSQVNSDKEQNVNIDKEKKSLTKGWNHWEGIGKISMGFENSLFRPEGMGERWWAYFESDSIASIYYDAAGKPKSVSSNSRFKFYKPLKFKIKGIISSKGSTGHMGMYQRQILIQGISEIEK